MLQHLLYEPIKISWLYVSTALSSDGLIGRVVVWILVRVLDIQGGNWLFDSLRVPVGRREGEEEGERVRIRVSIVVREFVVNSSIMFLNSYNTLIICTIFRKWHDVGWWKYCTCLRWRTSGWHWGGNSINVIYLWEEKWENNRRRIEKYYRDNKWITKKTYFFLLHDNWK